MPNLQDKLDKVARAVEPILWNILDEIDEGSGDWVTDYEKENNNA